MKNFLKWGIYITALQIIFKIVGYLVGWTVTPLGKTMDWVSMILSLGLLFMGIREKKMQDPTDFTFGRGWVEGTLISLVAAVLFAIFFFIFTDMINPEMIEYARAEAARNVAAQNIPKDQIEAAKKMMDIIFSPTGFAIGTLITYTISGMIISLIFSPIIKSMGGTPARTENA